MKYDLTTLFNLEWDYDVIISWKSKFRFREKLWIPQESLCWSSNKESRTYGKMYMTLTVVWHDVVLIANPVNMVYSDHSVLYYTFGLSKNVLSPGRIRDSFPPYHILAKLYSPLYQICLFSVPPSNLTSPTHRKNDRSLRKIVYKIKRPNWDLNLQTKARKRLETMN